MECVVVDMFGNPGDDAKAPPNNALETGFIAGGNASAPAGATWWDCSDGDSYGGGTRYEHEETYGMAKVPSRHKQDR